MRYTFPVVINLKHPPETCADAQNLAGCIETAIFNELEGEIDLGKDGGIWCGLPVLGVILSTAVEGPTAIPETDKRVYAEYDRRVQELEK